MRQGQQHNKNRSRGRGGNRGGGGRQSNPLNRVFESNGPDVKVRGNAQTIADKYLQLARDAVSSGENVNAENYFQHAEHYLRIVAAAQAFNQQNQQAQQQRRDDSDGDREAASGNGADADSKQASAGEDGGQDTSRQDNRRGSRGQRGNGRQRPAADDEVQTAPSSEGDENWQAQAPDFLRRETADSAGNANGKDDDDDSAEAKPKRQSRARKSKPAKASDAPDGSGSSDDGTEAEDVSAA